jgi:hypothetical protein
MSIARRITATIVVLGVVLLAGIGFAAPGSAPRSAALPATEIWRLGFTSEGNASDVAIVGRAMGIAASFRSNRGISDSYFLFPASNRSLTVQSAAYRILSRSGSYTGAAALTLEARAADGSLQRVISAVPIDTQTAATGAWATIALSPNPALARGEHLAIHFALDGLSAGDLELHPVFEVLLAADTAATDTPTATPTATATPGATTTPSTTPATPLPKQYLPVIRH